MAMNIPKAIEILHLVTDTPPSGASQDCIDAVKLGIAALKRFQHHRKHRLAFNDTPLPGETEE